LAVPKKLLWQPDEIGPKQISDTFALHPPYGLRLEDWVVGEEDTRFAVGEIKIVIEIKVPKIAGA
jgi:hypothetical protein